MPAQSPQHKYKYPAAWVKANGKLKKSKYAAAAAFRKTHTQAGTKKKSPSGSSSKKKTNAQCKAQGKYLRTSVKKNCNKLCHSGKRK